MIRSIVRRALFPMLALLCFSIAGSESLCGQETVDVRARDAANQSHVGTINDAFTEEDVEKALDAIPAEEFSSYFAKFGVSENALKVAYYVAQNARFSESQRLAAIKAAQNRLLGVREQTMRSGTRNPDVIEFEELSTALDKAAEAFPNSPEIAFNVSLAYSLYLRSTQPFGTPALNQRERYEVVRAKKIQTLVRALPALRKSLNDAKRWNARYDLALNSFGFQYYRDLVSTLARDASSTWGPRVPQAGERYRPLSLSYPDYWQTVNNYRRRTSLTPIDGDVDEQAASDTLNSLTLQNALLDEHGEIIFYQTPDSFEAAKNDGERVVALRNELFEFGDALVKADVLAEKAFEATQLFGINVAFNIVDDAFATTVPSPLSKIITDEQLRSLKNNETFVLIGSEPKRIVLPEDYAYLELWRKAFDYATKVCQSVVNHNEDKETEANPVVVMSDEYKLLFSLTRSAIVKEALLRRNPDLILEVDAVYSDLSAKLHMNRESFDAQLPYPFSISELSLKQLQAPCAAFYKKSYYDVVDPANLEILYRNADAADVVVKRVEFAPGVSIETFLDRMRNNPATGITAISQLLVRQLNNNMIDPQDQGVEYFQFQKVREETLQFDSPKSRTDNVATFKLDNLPPGAYLLEATATRGDERGDTDRAILWTHDLGILRIDKLEGTELRVYDALSGEPKPNIELDVYLFTRPTAPITSARNARQSRDENGERANANEEIITKRTATTDPSGKAFIDLTMDSSKSVSLLVAARRSKDEAFNLGAFLDMTPSSNLPRAQSQNNQLAFYFTTDRPLYQSGEKVTFQCCVHPDRLKELSAREISYCIYDNNGKIVVQKSNVPLDRFGSFTDVFEIPQIEFSQSLPPPFFTNFAIDIGDSFSAIEESDNSRNSRTRTFGDSMISSTRTQSAPVNPRRFNRFLAYGTICVQVVKEPQKIITLELAIPTETIKEGEPLRVKIRARDNNGEPVKSCTAVCSLEATQLPRYSPSAETAQWAWYYGDDRYGSTLYDSYFAHIKRRASRVELKLNEQGEAEYEFATALDAALYPNSTTAYAINVTARTPDGKLGRRVRNVPVENSIDVVPYAVYVPFRIQVEPNVVTPGQTATIRIERHESKHALARVTDRNGLELREPETIRFQNGVAEMKIDVNDSMTPEFKIDFFSIEDGKLICASKRVLVPPSAQLLALDLDYDRAQLQPGGKLTARVPAPKDAQGASVDAKLFVAYYSVALDPRTIAGPIRNDPRKTMTQRMGLRIDSNGANYFSNLANTLEPIASVNKMCCHPIFQSPSGAAFLSGGLADTLRIASADAALVSYNYAGDEYDVRESFQTAGVDYAQASANCGVREFELQADESEEIELALPSSGDDLVVEIVAVDERGRVGFLRRAIGAGK